MNEPSERPRIKELQAALAGALNVELGDVDLDAAISLFAEAGYETPLWLLEFLANYSELTVTWKSSRGDWVNELATSTEEAVEIDPENLRIYAGRIGRNVLPVGLAFETEEFVLLADNGDIFLAGDAGIQRVSDSFEGAIKKLIGNEWDKTFF